MSLGILDTGPLNYKFAKVFESYRGTSTPVG
jgi:hypothetical protein